MIAVKAVVEERKIRPLEPGKIEQFKSDIEEGEYVELTFKKWANSRTDRQNRYLHALIQRYRQAMGYSMSEAKNELCIEFGIAEEFREETFDPPPYTVRFVLYHGKLYMRKSTPEYTTGEMKTLIDGIKMACYENGIDIDDIEPEEL